MIVFMSHSLSFICSWICLIHSLPLRSYFFKIYTPCSIFILSNVHSIAIFQSFSKKYETVFLFEASIFFDNPNIYSSLHKLTKMIFFLIVINPIKCAALFLFVAKRIDHYLEWDSDIVDIIILAQSKIF